VSSSDEIAAALVRAWIRLYTLGLPALAREERRLTIDSDLWEQRLDATAAGETPRRTGASIVRRCLAGLAADLAWRLEVGRAPLAAPLALSPGKEAPMSEKAGFLLLSCLCGFGWALLLVAALQPPAHSLAYAGVLVGLLALLGWAIEVRDGETGDSYWPPLLAVGIGAVAVGLVLPWRPAALVLALPLALAASRAWLVIAAAQVGAAREPRLGPVASGELTARAAAGDGIAIERSDDHRLPRRLVLRSGLWLGLGAGLAAATGAVFNFLWERTPGVFGGVVAAGRTSDYPPGSKTRNYEGKFWLVNLTEDQGGPGLLALWQKCPHLGCTVPWERGFTFVDPASGERREGWFRCPCHQSTYNHAGVLVYGPAPRSMDRMALTIDPETGTILVDTSAITKGSVENASFAVQSSLDT
jgi:cytochrome b6-f complex iron-sulfur subunit